MSVTESIRSDTSTTCTPESQGEGEGEGEAADQDLPLFLMGAGAERRFAVDYTAPDAVAAEIRAFLQNLAQQPLA